MKKQLEIPVDKQSKKEKEQDEFAASCRPLEELLDSVRTIEGFPMAKDEDILALSDAPYYTACPNPYITDFIIRYGKAYDKKKDRYKRTPFVSDVTEGKNNPIYNAHSYHTKVPHKAIMPFIQHYTEPGDLVFDGFCGTGMTGIAAQLLGRKAILSDLSPVAALIAYNYNTPADLGELEQEANRILADVEDECGWMYETLHTDGRTKGKINFVLWSDVFICPYCKNEYVFWDVAVDNHAKKIRDEYYCPYCNAIITKKKSERSKVNIYDDVIGEQVYRAKEVPVLINYSVGSKRYEKVPDQADYDLIKAIEKLIIPHWFPTNKLPEGYNTEQPKSSHGITHVHQFYTKANLWTMAEFWNKSKSASQEVKKRIILGHSASNFYLSKMRRFRPDKKGGGPLAGTLYISSLSTPPNPILTIGRNVKNIIDGLEESKFKDRIAVISTQSTTNLLVPDNSIDYIFTDPPFGDNIMYSELNFIWEAWLKVFTNNKREAIMNNVQNKGLNEYKDLMTRSFKEMYRILKPNRWITVVFHNSKASVWNAIQDAMTRAGFVIAQVTVMDKKQGSFKQVTSTGAVKNDLVINAYKPKKEFEENFLRLAGEGLEQEFVEEHLDHLPIELNIERSEQMLYSKMLAHYIQRGYEIRLNAREFYAMLRDNFKMIDGYWFNDDQVLKYEEWKKAQGLEFIQDIKTGQQILFVTDEKSLLVWIYQFLESPQTYGDIYTASRKVITEIEDEVPELRELLDQNFILENGAYRRPRTRAEEEKLEAQRERDLMRSFEQILSVARSSTKKIKNLRKEALTLGFTQAYQEKRYQDIVDVAKRLDTRLIEKDSQINDFVEFARLMTGEEG